MTTLTWILFIIGFSIWTAFIGFLFGRFYETREQVKNDLVDYINGSVGAEFYANRNNDISPRRLEELLEDLADMGYLTAEGQKFRTDFWEMFIKEK